MVDKWLYKHPVTIYNIIVPVYKKVNKNFFKKWSSEMAYVLGFFAADGYITVNKRGGQFWCIQITDGELLKEIRKVMNSDHKISERVSKRPNEKNLYRLQIGSIEMCDDLRNLGFNERKTKSLVVPNVPKKYFSDFVRGYFDGDGSVWVGQAHKERKTQTLAIQSVFTSCSNIFLENLKLRLEDFDVIKGVVSKGKGDFYRLTYSINNTLKLYKFMYNRLGRCKLCLPRKKVVFVKYIKIRKISNAAVV